MSSYLPATPHYTTSTREGSPRKGGPKEARLYRVRMMDTGRYFDECIAKEVPFEDFDSMVALRVNNLFHTTNERLRAEFSVFGNVGDVYRPFNKELKKPYPFVFVRFLKRDEMMAAMNALQGKVIDGRPMIIEEAKANFELETSCY